MGFSNKSFMTFLSEEKRNGYLIFTLYKTDIVKINEEQIILNCGGFTTKHTASALNYIAAEYNLPMKANLKSGCLRVEFNSSKDGVNTHILKDSTDLKLRR